MGLLNFTLILVVLLTTTAAKPLSRRQDADIPDKYQPQRYLAELAEGSEESSEESSEEETEEAEEEETEEEEVIIDVTEAATIPPLLIMTTEAMTAITSGDGSVLTPEPDTANTVGPVIMVHDTTPGPVLTDMTTHVIITDAAQTSVRATEIRGDI